MPSIGSWNFYPRARENRLPPNHPGVRPARLSFIKGAGINFILLQVLFLCLFCYIFGALFQQTSNTHSLDIVFVDYDGGSAIGNAVRAAYASLRGPDFPSMVERPPDDFPTADALWEAVCQTEYWAALYVNQGASARLRLILEAQEDDGTAASSSTYDPENVMVYIWNQALYPTVVDVAISDNIRRLADRARVAYATGINNGVGGLQSVSGRAALSVFAEPWRLRSVNIQPTTQGSRVVYNTMVLVLVLIQEFFYLGTINGLYAQLRLYARLDPRRIATVRMLTSTAYTLAGSASVSGAVWAFRAGWAINGNQFALTWASLWLFAHANFLVLDVFTVWLRPGYVPMALITWVVLNTASALIPLPLCPLFPYRVLGLVMPAHAVYQLLAHVWSGGCNPRRALRPALPVLLAWEAVGLGLSVLGVFRRCHFATVAEERRTHEARERLRAAVAQEIAEMRKKKRPCLARMEDGGVHWERGHEGQGMEYVEPGLRREGVGKEGEERTTPEEEEGKEEKGEEKTFSQSEDRVGGGGVVPSTSAVAAGPSGHAARAGEGEEDRIGQLRGERSALERRASTAQRRQEERTTRRSSFGPSFNLPFDPRSNEESSRG